MREHCAYRSCGSEISEENIIKDFDSEWNVCLGIS